MIQNSDSKEMNLTSIVVTTIQRETASLCAFRMACERLGARIVVVADRKTPAGSWDAYPDFLAFESQSELGFEIADLLPVDHYSRKNLGYLCAIRSGSECIYDTDDDNAPLDLWKIRDEEIVASTVEHPPWLNTYALFGAPDTWPRGLPLEYLRHSGNASVPVTESRNRAPIQQGLANGSPDVDAVWRLVADREVEFGGRSPLVLAPGTWCPFNSQSTWWFQDAFPLMYLPSFVSFRMTDIWRSFIAQRCLWAIDRKLAFVGPEVYQDRNAHSLLRDFEQEIPGYLGNDRIRKCLESLSLVNGTGAVRENLRACYAALVDEGLIPNEEIRLLDAWLSDLTKCVGKVNPSGMDLA